MKMSSELAMTVAFFSSVNLSGCTKKYQKIIELFGCNLCDWSLATQGEKFFQTDTSAFFVNGRLTGFSFDI